MSIVSVNEMTMEVEEEGGCRQTKPSTERVLTHNVSEKRRKKVLIFHLQDEEYIATPDYNPK